MESIETIVKKVNDGEVVIVPTDTVYGLVCSISAADAIDEIYKMKQRPKEKSFIVFVKDFATLQALPVEITEEATNFLSKVELITVSVILNLLNDAPREWRNVAKSDGTIAIRIPHYAPLLEILSETGPLVSTSANISSEEVAKTVSELQHYFGQNIAISAGIPDNEIASTIVDCHKLPFSIIRKGLNYDEISEIIAKENLCQKK